jgi:hypothetical protein
MSPIVDDKKYATDTRQFGPAVLADGLINHFDESPISQHLTMKDICIYRPGDLNKIGKEGKTSWDSFSYALLMGHNVWMHIEAVQRANREYDNGKWPHMMRFTGTKKKQGDNKFFKDIVDSIFATADRAESEAIISTTVDIGWISLAPGDSRVKRLSVPGHNTTPCSKLLTMQPKIVYN